MLNQCVSIGGPRIFHSTNHGAVLFTTRLDEQTGTDQVSSVIALTFLGSGPDRFSRIDQLRAATSNFATCRSPLDSGRDAHFGRGAEVIASAKWQNSEDGSAEGLSRKAAHGYSVRARFNHRADKAKAQLCA